MLPLYLGRVLMMANRLPADAKVHRIALYGAGEILDAS